MFDKVVKSTVPGQVIEQIKELLVKGELKRGDRLPPERQLADMLGVSRPSLREALRGGKPVCWKPVWAKASSWPTGTAL